ncbi:hypothetical protein [Pseudonocardia sp. NPDC046786]|uniref:hypothetical protein n=1 Tax=Pseudonocardia sp. NPDC046786 TaxID=3155471 RepID=UPI0033EDA0D6
MTNRLSEPDSRARARWGGIAAVVAGLTGAGAAVFLVLVPPAVPEGVFSYPLTAAGFAVAQSAFFVHHLVAAAALDCLRRAGLAGHGRGANAAGLAAVVVLVLLGLQELVAIGAATAPYPSPRTDLIEAVYGAISVALAMVLVWLGARVVRAGMLTGAGRWSVLVAGLYVFVPLTPATFGPHVLARLAIGGWLLLFAWIGVAMLQWTTAGRGSPAVPL